MELLCLLDLRTSSAMLRLLKRPREVRVVNKKLCSEQLRNRKSQKNDLALVNDLGDDVPALGCLQPNELDEAYEGPHWFRFTETPRNGEE